jgi:hypothetical protein
MSRVTEMDWHAWHDGYDEPGTRLARRLTAVQDQIRVALDAAPPVRCTRSAFARARVATWSAPWAAILAAPT